jgi:hypothetical protein
MSTVTCPRCKTREYTPMGDPFTNGDPLPPALSRTDNKTYICSGCGTDEAMLDWTGAELPGPDNWPVSENGILKIGQPIDPEMLFDEGATDEERDAFVAALASTYPRPMARERAEQLATLYYAQHEPGSVGETEYEARVQLYLSEEGSDRFSAILGDLLVCIEQLHMMTRQVESLIERVEQYEKEGE